MKKTILAAVIAVAGPASVPSQAQQATTKDQLIGSWKVLNLKTTAGDKVTYPLGEQVAGYVTITPTADRLLLADATRKAPTAPTLTDAEAVVMMKTQVAWTGKYTTAEQTVDGINNRRLTLTPHPARRSSTLIACTSFELPATRSCLNHRA